MSSSDNPSALTPEATARHRRHVDAAAEFLRDRVDSVPSVALLLGAGGPAISDSVDVTTTIPYADIPHLPRATDEGTVIVGTWNDVSVVVLDALLPLHEGYTPRETVFPVRMLAAAGVETLCLTAVAGGIRSELAPGDLMLLTNHINFQGVNPLVGPNVDDWGPRFPDMTEPYDGRLNRAAEAAAVNGEGALRKGVYLGVLGPTLGTAAEYRMMRTLGADAVGTGLVPEVIAARHMGLRVLALALIADRCSTDAQEPVSVHDMQAAVAVAQPTLRTLLAPVVSAAAGAKERA
ncbi:MAG: purine-nucleoside phosphorylase [Salinivenus sp.]